MVKHYSAGGVVVGPNGKVIVVNQNNDSWSLPKGHIDPGENARKAAEREIHEESGVNQLEYICELGSYERPTIGKGGVGDSPASIKSLIFFLYRTQQQNLAPIDPENPEAVWVDIDRVSSMLTHHKDKEFFESVKPQITKNLAT